MPASLQTGTNKGQVVVKLDQIRALCRSVAAPHQEIALGVEDQSRDLEPQLVHLLDKSLYGRGQLGVDFLFTRGLCH